MPALRVLNGIAASLLLTFAGGLATAHGAEHRQLLDTSAFSKGAMETESTSFLRLKVTEPGKMESLYAQVPVTGAKALQLTYRVRYTDVKRGEKPWFDARIMLDFKDADGKGVKGSPPHPYYTGTSDGWRKETLRFAVPEGAATLSIMPTLFQARSGTFDLDALAVTTIDSSELPALQTDVKGDFVVDADGGGKPPLALHVDGNRILDADGKEIWLQGVSVPSLEWSNTGDAIVPSIITAITTWKANIIRLPVMGDRWFGRKDQNDGGAAYRALVDQAVLAASSRGAWLILDLHRFRAPTDDDVAFWKDAAAHYKDNPAVLFGLFNEPHDLTWEVWRNGGEVSDKKKNSDALAENKEIVTSFHTTGIQSLVDAARGTGARNPILAGGLDWSYDMSGVLNGFELDDKGGSGIIYDAHVYPWKSDWQHKFLDVAAKHPVLLGEVGCDSKRYDFIPPERFENPYTWAPDMIACIQKRKLHWTAWAFHPSCGPAMLLDQKQFTPSPFWGAFVRAALLGGRFESDKLR